MNAQHLGITPHTEVCTEVTGSLMEGERYQGADSAVGGTDSTAFGNFFSAHPQGYPTCQHVVLGDMSGHVIGVKPYLHQGVPNLFRLPAAIQAESVQAGTPFVAPVAAVWARSAPTTRVDIDSTGTVL